MRLRANQLHTHSENFKLSSCEWVGSSSYGVKGYVMFRSESEVFPIYATFLFFNFCLCMILKTLHPADVCWCIYTIEDIELNALNNLSSLNIGLKYIKELQIVFYRCNIWLNRNCMKQLKIIISNNLSWPVSRTITLIERIFSLFYILQSYSRARENRMIKQYWIFL